MAIEELEAPCQGQCCNHVVSHDAANQPAPYIYYVTGDPSGPYRWPVDNNQYVRISALSFNAQPFTLPFNDPKVVHFGTWIYQAPPQGNYHHAIDYLRPNDWQTFEVRAAAPGKVVFSGWDNWSGNTIILSHDVNGVTDSFRTVYMHLRNGPSHDIDSAWNNTVPTLSGATLTNYKNYLNDTGAAQNPAQRNPDPNYWGTNAHAVDPNLVGKTVVAGDHIAWAGCTGPGGCGCTKGMPGHPNTHLHIFFVRRDPVLHRPIRSLFVPGRGLSARRYRYRHWALRALFGGMERKSPAVSVNAAAFVISRAEALYFSEPTYKWGLHSLGCLAH